MLLALWSSTVPAWFGWAAVGVVIGWLAFTSSGSAAVVGLTYAVRLAPLAIVAVPAGAASDRVGRRPMLLFANAASAICALALAVATSLAPEARLAVALVLAIAFGCFDAIRLVVAANVSYDAVAPDTASRAIGISSLVAGLGQTLGAVFGGVLVDQVGGAGASVVIAVLYLAAVVPLVFLPRVPPHDRATGAVAQLREGIDLALHDPVVGALVVVALVAEMLGFAGMALDPIFAGDVFMAGALGLGLISGTRAAGRLVGSLGLGFIRLRRVGESLAVALILFGIGLMAFASAPSILLALPGVALAGLAGVVVDSLEQTALQAGVSDQQRGRAAGLWVFSLGLGPIGIALLSITAQFVGPRTAQILSGAAVLVFGVLVAAGIVGRSLRRLEILSDRVDVTSELGPFPGP